MKDLRAWVAAIRAEPDDDTPRLACADWLEEQGQPERAELVRVQCGLARCAGDDPRRPGLWRREQELLAAHARDWLAAELPAWARPGAEFRRGFVGHVAAQPAALARGAKGLLARAPVESVRLSRGHPEDIARLVGCAALAGLRHLCVNDFHPDASGRLLDAPFFDGLRSLHLIGWSRALTVDNVTPLLEPGPAALVHLDLDSFGLLATGLPRLLASGAFGRIESVHLNVAVDSTIRDLVASPRVARLRALDLGDNALPTDAAVRDIARSPHLGRLNRLSLWWNMSVTNKGVRALARSDGLQELTDLDLRGTKVTEATVRELVGSEKLPRLSRIDLTLKPGIVKAFPLRPWLYPNGSESHTLWVREARG